MTKKPAYIMVPADPPAELIESMCMRYRHDHGIPQNFPEQETDEQFRRRQEGTRTTMRQLYEEATGQGYYRIPDAPKLFLSTPVDPSTISTADPGVTLIPEST